MIRSLLLFELNYQSRQWAFWGMTIFFLGLGWLLGHQGYIDADLNANSTYQILYHNFLLSLGIVFSIMFHVVTGVLRDPQHLFEPILYTTSLTKKHYFISRFIGVWSIGFFILSMALIGYGTGILTGSNSHHHSSNISGYAIGLLITVFPNVFITSSVIFSVAVLSKRSMWTYLSAVLMYVIYWISAIFLNSPMLAQTVQTTEAELITAALADPFGLSAFFQYTHNWTSYQKNNETFLFGGYLLANRILWLCISMGLLFLSFRKCSFRSIKKRSKNGESTPTTSLSSNNFLKDESYLPIPTNSSGVKYWYRLFKSQLKIDLSYMIKNLPFVGGLSFWLVIVTTEIYISINNGGSYQEKKYPTTDLLMSVIGDPLPFMALILIIYYSGMLLWRERNLQLSPLIEATPMRSATLFMSKLITLLSVPIILISSAIIIGIGFQLISGDTDLDFPAWLTMFYSHGYQLFFYCIVALTIQAFAKHTYSGMILTAIILMFLGTPLASLLGIQHPMLMLGAMPDITYNNMCGYGYTFERFHDYAMYWGSLASLLVIITMIYWPRGESNYGIPRLHGPIQRIIKHYGVQAFIVTVGFLLSGWNIYQHTNVEQEYITQKAALDLKEAYERKYKKYDNIDRLHRVSLKSTIDLYPQEGNYKIQADHILQNKHDHPINELFITDKVWVDSMRIDNARLIERDEQLGTWLFQFDPAVQPGEQVAYHYIINYKRNAHDAPRMIAKNGSYLMQQYINPSLSYRSSREISDAEERAKRGLPKRIQEESTEEHISQHDVALGKIPFEVTISTVEDQIAIAPGDLIQQWNQDNSNYFHYKSEEKLIPFISYASGDYIIKEEEFRGVKIQQYYHPDHHHNIDAIQQYTKATLAYCIDHFGDYNMDHLRMLELPGHWNSGGQAMPGTIAMVEDNLYLVDIRDSTQFDLIAKRVIHEVAHQWWGNILSAKNVAGGSLLIEGFAKYTEGVVMQELFGKWPLIQLSQNANDSYFRGRSMTTAPEPPVYLAEGENYLCYGKMYSTMMATADLIGQDSMNMILARLVEEHRDDIDFEVTSLAFLDLLSEQLSPQHKALVDDWFRDKIIYDLSIDDAVSEQKNNGNYEVTFDVSATRQKTLDDGSTADVDINEPMMIGIFQQHPKTCYHDSGIIFLDTILIDKTNTTHTIVVTEEPAYIAIDPYGTKTEEDSSDNIDKIQIGSLSID